MAFRKYSTSCPLLFFINEKFAKRIESDIKLNVYRTYGSYTERY